MGSGLENTKMKGVYMKCMNCLAKAEKGVTTSVTDLDHCLIIIRNVPCFKCSQCNEILYTGDVVEKLESIIKATRQLAQEISVIDYSSAA